ncbi:MAG: alpha/beta hydrolase [Proteobacteria bacterium]|nr:alpha/beta hydrolase [Pseudomonadota bacterium]
MVKFNCRGIELDGTRQGKGPALLALHGGGGPGSVIAGNQKLAETFEVIAPTHPGFGHSPVADRIQSVEDLSYLYLDLMDALDLRDVTLMGFSLGGWIAAEMAVKNTTRIARLILVDAVGIRVPDRADCEIADVFFTHPSKMPALAFHDPSQAPNPKSLSDEERLMMYRAREAMARYSWEPYMHNPKLMSRLHRIDVPTLLIWGESDGIVPVAYGEAYRDAIPGAQLTVIGEAGHQPQAEQTDKFVAEVLSFAAPATAA